MLLSLAAERFINYTDGTVYSPKYIPTIKSQLNRVINFFGKRQLESLTLDDWLSYIRYLRYDYKPKRLNGNQASLAEATIHNHLKMIHGFYRWANEILSIQRVDLKLPRLKYQSPQAIPFSEKEVQKLMCALEYSGVEKKSGQTYRIKRKYPDRNRAIIMILLDTGIRAGELSRLRLEDVNLENNEIYIRPYRDGRKSKARTVFLGNKSTQALSKYIAGSRSCPSNSLFDLDPSAIRFLIRRIGENAGVANSHPHRFRHTFAIAYLRNFGSVFTLQKILGHSTPDMSLKYLHIAVSDVADQHRRASPVDNWNI